MDKALLYVQITTANLIGRECTEHSMTRSQCQLIISLHFNGNFSRWTWVSRYQKVSNVDFRGARDDGNAADNWSYKPCKASVNSSPPTNQHPVSYKPAALPVNQPTV